MRILWQLVFSQLLLIAPVAPYGFTLWVNGKRVTDPAQLEKFFKRYPQFKPPNWAGAAPPVTSTSSYKPVSQKPQGSSPSPAQPNTNANSQNGKETQPQPSSTAQGAISLSANVIKFALEEHNNYRKKVAKGQVPKMPAATVMNELTWSNEIASKASAWAAKCSMNHSPSGYYCGLEGYDNIGENLAASTTSADGLSTDEQLKNAFQNAFKRWFDEYTYYNFSTRACSKVCGHFTQMIKDSSEKLGCGIALCKNGITQFILGRPAYIIVCNYGPGNNFSNKPAYETANGKECPQVRPVRKDYLCTGNGKKGPKNCVDNNSYCSVWKREGKCELCNNPYYNWMVGECPRTCGIC
ncbi:venom allergen 5 [Trichuris trichiura]|uniref:Venom allergen 5 n=1 Tax=Trichuris trichiura TaxID=36087 RepID=A0A077ZNW5_TRITR|nr:venom allergen 5 [Trichuris trichiura]